MRSPSFLKGKNLAKLNARRNASSEFDADDTVVPLRSAAANAKRKQRRNNTRYMAKVRERMIGIAVAILNKDHAYIERGNDVCIVSMGRDYRGRLDLKFRNRLALTELYDSKRIKLPKINRDSVTYEWENPVKLWARHPNRRNLRGLVNVPGQHLSDEWLNLWAGWGTQPLLKDGTPDFSGEKCKLIIGHIVNIWCSGNERIARWVLAWFADILQNPAKKPDTAIMAYSGQGTGKSFHVENVMSRILGSGYGYEDSPEFLHAKFNKRVAGKLLIYADEAFFHGDKGAADRLKAFVSKKVITIEEKGKDSYETDHFARIVATTNRGHALAVDNDDRRWLILEVNEDRKKDYQYFAALEAEIEAGGVEAFHAFLLNPDLLTGINLRETPDTPAMTKQKVQSLDTAEAFVYECLHAQTVELGHVDTMRHDWPSTVGKAEWYKSYVEWCKAQSKAFPRRDSQFGEIVKKLLKGIQDGRSGSANRHWKLPPIDEARALFANWIGCPDDRASLRVLWDDLEDDQRELSDDEFPVSSLADVADVFGPKDPMDDVPF